MKAVQPRRTLVVGGTAGIGKAAARALLQAGHAVVIAGRDAARGQDAAAEIGARAVRGDGAVVADARRMIDEAASILGGLDVVVSSAGGNVIPRLLNDMPLEEVLGDIHGTLAPVVLPAKAAFDRMRADGQGGTILLVASDAGKVATPGESAIGAGMAAIAMFARTLALEGKRHAINVNCLTPSIVRGTPLYDRLMADAFSAKLFAKAEAAAQLGIVEADDLAGLVAFLASPAAAKISGQTISMNGGISFS